jgi:uncharacterized protein
MKKFVCGIAVCVLLYGAGFAGTAPPEQPVPSFGRYQPTPLYSEAVTTSQYLTLRDGVRLAISITRPSQNGNAVEGRFPVLWQHTLAIMPPGVLAPNPSGAMPGGYNAVPGLAYYGYVVVQVARRGQGPSFGKRRGYNDRIRRGYAVTASQYHIGDNGLHNRSDRRESKCFNGFAC